MRNRHADAIIARVVCPISPWSPYYIFLAVQPDAEEDYQHYRAKRWAIAQAYLIEAKRKFHDAKEVVVLATEMPGWSKWASEDLIYRGNEPLRANEEESAQKYIKYIEEQGILSRIRDRFEAEVLEYPSA